jgi:hypothetical protein
MLEDGERGGALSVELGVSANQLYKWCMHFRRGGAEGLRPTCHPRQVPVEFDPATDLATARKRIGDLQRKVGQQQLELDVLANRLLIENLMVPLGGQRPVDAEPPACTRGCHESCSAPIENACSLSRSYAVPRQPQHLPKCRMISYLLARIQPFSSIIEGGVAQSDDTSSFAPKAKMPTPKAGILGILARCEYCLASLSRPTARVEH